MHLRNSPGNAEDDVHNVGEVVCHAREEVDLVLAPDVVCEFDPPDVPCLSYGPRYSIVAEGEPEDLLI